MTCIDRKTTTKSSTPFNHNIAFDLNGGSGTIKSFNVKDNVKFTIPTARPTRPAYTFLGWYVRRRADNPQKWYAGVGWSAWDAAWDTGGYLDGHEPILFKPGTKCCMNAAWTNGCAASDYMFYARWRKL